MSYRWVNQGGSFAEEQKLGCIFASKITRGGRKLAHHWAVRDVRPGDVIFHNVKSRIVAVSVAAGLPREQVRPYERPAYARNVGFLAPTSYHTLDVPIRISDIPLEWRQEEAANNDRSPFTRDGSVWFAYLTPVSECFASKLVEHYRTQLPDAALALAGKR